MIIIYGCKLLNRSPRSEMARKLPVEAVSFYAVPAPLEATPIRLDCGLSRLYHHYEMMMILYGEYMRCS